MIIEDEDKHFDFDILKTYDEQIKVIEKNKKELEEKIKALKEIEIKRANEKEQLEREFRRLPPVLASTLKEINELDRQIEDSTNQMTQKAQEWKKEALKSGINEKVVNFLLDTLGFDVLKEGETITRNSREKVEKVNLVEMSDLNTLINSSPKTLEWLDKIKTDVEGKISYLKYEQKKYWALFKSKVTNRNICYLNPTLNQIRLLTKLFPYEDYTLKQSPVTEPFKEYSSLFIIKSENDIEKAIELITLSWIRD